MQQQRSCYLPALVLTCLLWELCAHASLESILEPISLEDLPAYQATVENNSTDKLPEKTIVHNKKKELVRIRIEDITKSIHHHLTQQYVYEGVLKVYILKKWKEIWVENSHWKTKVVEFPANGLSSRMRLHLRLFWEEEIISEWLLPIRAELWQDVYITKRYLNRSDTLDKETFIIESRDVLASQHPMVPIKTDLSAYELDQSIAAGDPLLWRSLTEKPLVRKGQLVKVFVEEGKLQISMKALAMQSGLTGEFIKVRNLNSRRDFHAQIINEGLVKVHF